MTWSNIGTDLPTNWVDNVGMIENATFLNKIGNYGNAAAAALNAMVGGIRSASVATAETISSATYTDLATTTDQVTVTVGSSGVVAVFIASQSDYVAGTSGYPVTGFAVSGANTQAAADYWATGNYISGVTPLFQRAAFILTGLAAGSTTFKMKYRRTGDANYNMSNRRIAVIPFP